MVQVLKLQNFPLTCQHSRTKCQHNMVKIIFSFSPNTLFVIVSVWGCFPAVYFKAPLPHRDAGSTAWCEGCTIPRTKGKSWVFFSQINTTKCFAGSHSQRLYVKWNEKNADINRDDAWEANEQSGREEKSEWSRWMYESPWCSVWPWLVS